MTPDFDQFDDHGYKRGGFIDHEGRKERVEQIIRTRGGNLILPPKMAEAEEQRRRKAVENEMKRHDVFWGIDHDQKATARRLKITTGDEDVT